jgi:hypothetical protein
MGAVLIDGKVRRCSLAIAALLLSGTAFLLNGCGVAEDRRAAEDAVAEFRNQYEVGNYQQIYGSSDVGFRAALSESDFSSTLEAMRVRLGSLRTATIAKWNVNSYGAKTKVTLVYSSQFERASAVETFVFQLNGRSPTLVAYFIKSDALRVRLPSGQQQHKPVAERDIAT